MKYPKAIMSKKELMEMGFPESLLLRASREPNQDFCWRLNALNKTSPLLFDTQGFNNWIMGQVGLHNKIVKAEKAAQRRVI